MLSIFWVLWLRFCKAQQLKNTALFGRFYSCVWFCFEKVLILQWVSEVLLVVGFGGRERFAGIEVLFLD